MTGMWGRVTEERAMRMAEPKRLPPPASDEVLKAMERLLEAADYPPTLREIAEALGHPLSTIHGALVDMREAGTVTWEDRKPRTLRRL